MQALIRTAMSLILGLASVPTCAELELKLSAYKREYLLDEPFYATVTLKNTGKSDVRVQGMLYPGGILTLEVTAPGEPPHKYGPMVSLSLGPDAYVKGAMRLAPGEEYSAGLEMTRDSNSFPRGLLLSQPGKYSIKATYAIPKDIPGGPVTVHSDNLCLVVKSPKGTDRRAYDVLKKSTQFQEMGPWWCTEDQKHSYALVLKEYPNSGYAIYARHFLAEIYHYVGSFGKRGTREGMAATKRAAKLYAAVAEKAGGTPLGVQAARYAGRAYATAGDVVNAQRLFEESFLSPASSNEEQRETLSWLNHLRSGYWQMESGLTDRMISVDVQLPLRAFAEAMGFSVLWDQSTKVVSVQSPKVHCALRPGGDTVAVDGGELSGFPTWQEDGRVKVSVPLIGLLLGKHYDTVRYDFLLRPTQLP